MNIITFLLIKLMIDYEYVKNIYFGYRYIEGEREFDCLKSYPVSI